MSRPEYEILSSDDNLSREFLIVDRYGRPVVNNGHVELIGAPLDCYSITKRELGDLKYDMQISIGIEQLLHPEIGAAVEHTGKFGAIRTVASLCRWIQLWPLCTRIIHVQRAIMFATSTKEFTVSITKVVNLMR